MVQLFLASFLLGSQAASAASTEPVTTAVAAATEAANKAAYERLLRQGHAGYARGDYAQAVADYKAASRLNPADPAPWLNGGAVLDEAGEPAKAVYWYARASLLDPADDEILCALGWAQLRSRNPTAAASNFTRVLRRQPDQPSATLGLARAELATAQPEQAVVHLSRAAGTYPFVNLSYYFLGRAYESLSDRANAIDAYRQAVGADSHFPEARQALGRLYLKGRRFNDAFKQLLKILDADPRNSEIARIMAKVRPLMAHDAQETGAEPWRFPAVPITASPVFPQRVPVLRIGIGTTPMGHPRPLQSLAFSATTPFVIVDAKTGKHVASADADTFWMVRIRRVKGEGLRMELTSDAARLRVARRRAFIIMPRYRNQGAVALNLSGRTRAAAASAEKLLRGEVEIALINKTLRVVNRIDLENYTHGVVSAEMPVRSPMEALKAQAVVARTHALYIKTVTRRHRHDGYDLCDEQHCQVYGGARAESERSRAAVDTTRGIIVTYRNKPAHTIYSSNCGGYTQNGRDVTGWGDVPYWTATADASDPPPASPWALRRWLTSLPRSYCQPSNYVHPSHFRWTRIAAWSELSRRVDRRYRIGRLKAIRVLRRAASGNVNAILLEGTRRRIKVDSELAIRDLPGLGSLRSTLFIFTPEFGSDGSPEAMVFNGGGWGHGVGMCQSGAIGRAEGGQDFAQILLSYFPGTALGRSDYAALDNSVP